MFVRRIEKNVKGRDEQKFPLGNMRDTYTSAGILSGVDIE